MPLMSSAAMRWPCSQSSWRLIQTKLLSSSASFFCNSACGMSSNPANCPSLARSAGLSWSTSSGIAQEQAVAIQNSAAVGGQRQCAGKAHLALALEEGIVEHLHMGRARAQPDKAQRNQRHDELAAPYRRLAGQQRAQGVEHAAAHGCAPSDAKVEPAPGAIPC